MILKNTGELLARGNLDQAERVEVLDANGPRVVSHSPSGLSVELPGGWKHRLDVFAGQVKVWGDSVVCAGLSLDGNILVEILNAKGDVENGFVFSREGLGAIDKAAAPAGGGANVPANRGIRVLPNGRILRGVNFSEGAFRFALIVNEQGIYIVTEANLVKISAEKE